MKWIRMYGEVFRMEDNTCDIIACIVVLRMLRAYQKTWLPLTQILSIMVCPRL